MTQFDEPSGENQDWFVTSGLGAGEANTDEACVMVKASLEHARRNGYIDKVPLGKILTDHPCWANEALTYIAIFCNDRADDVERQRIKPMLERVLRCERRTPEVERRINARVLCAQARKVLHLIPEDRREPFERAVATREAWLRGEASEDDCQEAAWAAGAAKAAGAAEAAWAAKAAWAAEAAEAAKAAWAAGAAEAARAAGAAKDAGDFDPIAWLDDALDCWEKAAAEEGALLSDGEAERLVNEFVQAAGG